VNLRMVLLLNEAGIAGSNCTFDGYIECDAALMDSNGHIASVAAVPMTSVGGCLEFPIHTSPIQICHSIIQEHDKGLWDGGRVPPLFTTGRQCHTFAETVGLPMTTPADAHQMITANTKERFQRHLKIVDQDNADLSTVDDSPFDTVGAIVIDNFGKMAVASSSGGISLKSSGRVGSAALIGSGLLVEGGDKIIGVTCSGTGESIMKSRLATNVERACRLDIPLADVMPSNVGCLVCIKENNEVELLWPHTTDSFCIYYATENKSAFKISRTSNGQLSESAVRFRLS
jgi:isoaspartyl peptidase/L-asparaginase-like protein (Ntn-hydrolase superfamily)